MIVKVYIDYRVEYCPTDRDAVTASFQGKLGPRGRLQKQP